MATIAYKTYTTPETELLLKQAFSHTSTFKQKKLWTDAVTFTQNNNAVVKLRLLERRRRNAKIKAKVKRDILGRSELVDYLGLPVRVSTLLFPDMMFQFCPNSYIE
ncbi:hypothetical protein FSP39_015654 [Pinctada imbricata]|uniref:Uncharacterized protein n=1 Tax=Pinctada imbricata TaxID=66713 RepID=A0AA88Y8R5_PINIB|nr:hypothetical protein FSP39_015654 [Pinctada imbricata]